ncbi:MAG: hypothetical protein MUD14_09350 [Hydrococcus sp. Prado102]|jgi:hypothetical protein|nr:hypothetical protein [Hydrococcus sp. Prado102]
MVKKSIPNILTSGAIAIGMTVLNSGVAFTQTEVKPTTPTAPATQTEVKPTTQPAPTNPTQVKPTTPTAPATQTQTEPTRQTTARKISFVCATNSNPPTTYALTHDAQKKPSLKPLLTWHSEYLIPGESAEALCQKMAQELQGKYERGETPYFAYDLTVSGANSNQPTRWRVCFVSSEGESCSTESEELFSLNSTYVPTCLAENKEPEACNPYIQKRGSLIKIPADRPWWAAFF